MVREMKIKLAKQYKFSQEVIKFIEETIMPELNLSELNDDNIDEICTYAACIESAFVDKKRLTKKEKELFEIAINTVTELSLYDN